MNMANELKGLEDRYQLQTYGKFPFFIDKGAGCYVYDEEGNKYLDFYGAHAVASTGSLPSTGCKSHSKTGCRADLLLQCQLQLSPSPSREKAPRDGRRALLPGFPGQLRQRSQWKMPSSWREPAPGARKSSPSPAPFTADPTAVSPSTGIPKYTNYLNTPCAHASDPAGRSRGRGCL